eukprot:TRINITY_DN13883_c0_g1_i1.p1 TRINITY_DN13883_c0_g1~~TRINITY_DN13883_c0_g1_i1.p1  ORF type:complete len:389 (+),score=44.36 TRINITY_DN13883_c0_g1_i1:378-1544(+)
MYETYSTDWHEIDWKNASRQRYLTVRAWCNGGSPTLRRVHDTFDAVLLRDDLIVASLGFWDRCGLIEIDAHTLESLEPVRSFHGKLLDLHDLVVCYGKEGWRVFAASPLRLVYEGPPHFEPILNATKLGNHLLLGSVSSAILVDRTESDEWRQQVFVFEGKCQEVALSDRYAVCAADSLQVFSVFSGEQHGSLDVDVVAMAFHHSGLLVCGCRRRQIGVMLVDLDTLSVLCTATSSVWNSSCLRLLNDRIFCSNRNSGLRVFEITVTSNVDRPRSARLRKLHTYKQVHSTLVNSLLVTDAMLVSCSAFELVVWEHVDDELVDRTYVRMSGSSSSQLLLNPSQTMIVVNQSDKIAVLSPTLATVRHQQLAAQERCPTDVFLYNRDFSHL